MPYQQDLLVALNKQGRQQYNTQTDKKTMMRLSALLGANPLRHHVPVRCVRANYLYSVGECGQIIAWEPENLQPIYQIIPSIIADTDQLIDMAVIPLRLINNELQSAKIVTIHEDGRLRIHTAKDGLCVNISPHNMLPEKLVGIVQTQIQSRFLLVFAERNVYIIDSWTMKAIDRFQPTIQSYSIIKKARINDKKELELMDKQSKSYRINIEQLFDQVHLDVGNWISNAPKAIKLLEATVQKIKQQKTVSSYRKINPPDSSQFLRRICQIVQTTKSSNIWLQIFDPKYHTEAVVKAIIEMCKDQQPIVSNCYFIKGIRLWYFFGTTKGRIFGLPVIMEASEQILLLNPEGQNNSPVAYLNFVDNLLIASWQNGQLGAYTIDNLDYTIQSTINNPLHERIASIPGHMAESEAEIAARQKLYRVDINKNRVIYEQVSAEIKYRLEIYSLKKKNNGSQTLAFQLINNEIIIFDGTHKRISNYRGVPQKSRVFSVLELQDYIGISHTEGVDLYSADRYQRTISYAEWIWSDYQFCEQFRCKVDYHNIASKVPMQSITGLQMFEFCGRYFRKKLDYYAPSLDLLYQTFGMVQTEQITNQMYPIFHFIQRKYVERAVHSCCAENATSIIRLKHDNIRRQKLSNTSFLYTANLNRQLQVFTNDKNIPFAELQKNYGLFSLFWDDNPVPFLTNLYTAKTSLKFLLRRRYAEQGIGKTFTIYFNNKAKHELSEQLLTYSSVSSVALLQVCSTKNFELADQMVNVVEDFTVKRVQRSLSLGGNKDQSKKPYQINIQTLSQLSLSQNHHILKACINILMSTALTQKVPLHPVYEYFILNIKNLTEKEAEDAKRDIQTFSMSNQTSTTTTKLKSSLGSFNKVITDIETIWFVYLGIGFIYSNNQIIDNEQVKILIMRLIETIDVSNFEERPDLMLIVLKVFNEGVKKWKSLITANMAMKIYVDLFKIYFLYDGLTTIPADDKKFNFCFEKVPPSDAKRNKQQIVKTITYLSKEFSHEFLQVLRIQALNQKPHPAYPASVVEILRQFLKNQRPKTNLVFYIELLLQCLSPMTPNLRKYVQKNVLATLQLMCSYESISFNQPSQKLSLRTDSNIYIYCLRTSTKWRTISLKDQKKTEESLLQMSPKGTYIALLGQKLRIWRLSSGFWSGVLGAFSQGWTFEAEGNALKWDEKQESITVINQNPSLNKCFKL